MPCHLLIGIVFKPYNRVLVQTFFSDYPRFFRGARIQALHSAISRPKKYVTSVFHRNKCDDIEPYPS